MTRIRTIQPQFPRSASMGRISREARLLFILLWTIVDDEGRCHDDLGDLARVLYPSDFDASIYLSGWLDELEREQCIERYTIDEVDYLRVVRWREHQWIGHPTRSHLPPSPRERRLASGIPEASGRLRDHGRKSPCDQSLDERSETLPENDDVFAREAAELAKGGELTPDRILGYLDLALRKSLAAKMPTAPARYIELAGRHRGMWGGKGASVGKEEVQEPKERDVSPAEFHDLPDLRPTK